MANTGFTRKKVESMTLGEKLRKIRSEYHIDLEDVAKQTRIRVQYLEYLENGEYEKLPAEVYVRGFVRNYANFLGADENVLLKMYEQENNVQRNMKKEHFLDRNERSYVEPRLIITPKWFAVAGFAIAFLTGSVYLYREFRAFAAEPRLLIEDPFDGQVTAGEEAVIRGITDKDVTLLINGQAVSVRDDGGFSEQVRLRPGLNTFSVSAVNKFKKEKTISVSIQSERPKPVVQEMAPAENLAVPPNGEGAVAGATTEEKNAENAENKTPQAVDVNGTAQ